MNATGCEWEFINVYCILMDISGIPQKTSLLDYLKYIVDNDTRSNLPSSTIDYYCDNLKK